jgi:glutamate:Na+ symporter, ESS family
MLSFCVLCLLIGVAYVLCSKIAIIQKMFLPTSVVAGLLGLILVQVCLKADVSFYSEVFAPWSKFPSMLINVVFACLFLGAVVPNLSKMVDSVGRQLAYGQIVAWGQYLVSCLLVLFLLSPLFNVSDLFIGIMPVGFEGGHGTAAGMGPVFTKLGWEEGKDIAMASATFGAVSAIIIGMVLSNWAIRKKIVMQKEEVEVDELSFEEKKTNKESKYFMNVDVLTQHVVYIGLSILVGLAFQKGLLFIANSTLSGKWQQVFSSFPLFPFCMLGGILINSIMSKFKVKISSSLMAKIQQISLDFLIISAIATIKIETVAKLWLPLLLVVVLGILWNVFCVLFVAKRVFKDAWFERSIAEMGQSMGTTATGLLLLRVVDPDYKTPAAEAFAGKQILHEPFMGGGLWTSMAIPLLAVSGGLHVLYISLVAMILWSAVIVVLRLRSAK